MNLPKLKSNAIDIWCLRLLIGSSLLLGSYQFFKGNNRQDFIFSSTASILFILLRIIYFLGLKRFVRLMIVFIITLLIIFVQQEPYLTKEFSGLLYFTPLFGMLFLGFPGLIIAASISYLGLLIRGHFAAIYTDPRSLIIYFVAYLGLIWIINWKSDTERRIAEENAKAARDAGAEVERQNITLKERTQQIHEEQTKLKASIETFPRGFILTDNQGNIILANRFIQKIFNIEKRPSNLRVLQYNLGDAFDLVQYNSKATTERQAIIFHEILFGSKYLRILINPIPAPHNSEEMLGSIILIEDITEEKVLQKSREEFFSITSHELRTPLLTIAKKVSEIYNAKITSNDKDIISEDVEKIEDMTQHLLGVVNDLIMTSQLEQSEIKFQIQPVNIIKVVESTIKEIQPALRKKGISCIMHTPKEILPKVLTDKGKTKEVLVHLLNNAEKFTQKGYITVTLKHIDAFIKISVQDTGIGIPKENQSMLFRKYQKAQDNKGGDLDIKSTGMGLYISKLIIENLGGSITLEKSEKNKGSVFSFTVPVAA